MSELPKDDVTEITFPAVTFKQAGRSCMLGKIPIRKLWWVLSHLKEGTNLERSQRKINENRLPKITKYVEQEDYVIPPVVLTIEGMQEDSRARKVTLPYDCQIWINDGQHRIHALKDFDTDDELPVMILPFKNAGLCAQNFTDLNKNLVKPNKSLQIYYDQRNVLAQYLVEKVLNKDDIEFQETTVKGNSEKKYSFGAMYDAMKVLNGDDKVIHNDANQIRTFYEAVKVLWLRGRTEFATVKEYREKSILPHGVMLDILSIIARKIFEAKDGGTEWIDVFENHIVNLPILKTDPLYKDVVLEGILIKKKTNVRDTAVAILSRK